MLRVVGITRRIKRFSFFLQTPVNKYQSPLTSSVMSLRVGKHTRCNIWRKRILIDIRVGKGHDAKIPVNRLLHQIDTTGSGRRRNAHIDDDERQTVVEELVLSQENVSGRHRAVWQIARETVIRKSSFIDTDCARNMWYDDTVLTQAQPAISSSCTVAESQRCVFISQRRPLLPTSAILVSGCPAAAIINATNVRLDFLLNVIHYSRFL